MSAVEYEEVLPFVSVAVPVRNETLHIERCLRAVVGQDYPANRFEVLVADGESSDRTREQVATIAAEFPEISIALLNNPGRIVPTGLNVALARARGEVFIRVDGHTVIESDYVKECVRALARSGASNVGGPMRAVGEGLFGGAISLATSTPFGVGSAKFHYAEREEWVDTVYLGAWPRTIFDRVGHFDEEMVRNQDDEFNYRLREAGGRIFLTPRIKSSYYPRTTPLTLCRQYFQYGYWKVRVMQKHPRQMQLRQFVPPAFVLAILCFLLPLGPIVRPVLGTLLLLYALLNVLASVWVARRGNWSVVYLIPLAFCAIHLSYGTGFLAGLVRFWNRWSDRTTSAKAADGGRAAA